MENGIATLVERARKGDRGALTTLVRESSPGIYRFALRMMRSEEEARDVSQETFLRMIKNFDRYDPRYGFNTWLYRIARNLCIDRLRHSSRWKMERRQAREDEGDPMERLPDAGELPLDGLLSRELKSVLESALRTLKPKYREVLVLFHFEEMSYQEISDVLQIPIGTVMNRIFRARRQLRTQLGDSLSPA